VPENPFEQWRPTVRRRLLVVVVIFGLWTTGIQARLVYLQVLRHDDYVARAQRQQLRTAEIAAKRGEILDRTGRVLAYSVDVDSIFAVPAEIRDPDRTISALCGVLKHCTPEFRKGLMQRLRSRRHFVWVRRQVSHEEGRRIAALDLEGIGFLDESKRFYPNGSLASHVLGYVGIDNVGLGGIERSYDSQIRGKAGTALVQTDARRRTFSRTERPPTSGDTVELTIDQVLQWYVERELKAGVAEHNATGGTIIVMDPATGEILAMANEPSFNPNAYARVAPDLRRNRAIQEIFEPGSTFKVVTASAALEENVMGLEAPIDVSPGYIRIGSRQVNDVRRYGVLSFTDVMVKSSNVGAIKVGFKLGPERLGRYVRRFGFGRTLLPDLGGESPGIVWSTLSDSALASVSMGYQIGVTPLQMAAAFSAVANGGELVQPRLVRAVRSEAGRQAIEPVVLRRTISAETAARLTGIMEEVVERGTAKAARIEGYTIAGKTGTAAKLVNGVYSKSQYNASFVGYAPSRSPVATILVVIDTPKKGKFYGGSVAAPVFKRVAEITLRHLGVPRTIDPEPPVLVLRAGAAQAVNTTATASPASVPMGGPSAAPAAVRVDGVPDVRGLGAREATRVLVRAGVVPRLRGDGIVVGQWPEPGTPLDEAVECELRLERVVAAAASFGAGANR
jgi:cell division protein FtsI (penicillin-binding protein 3)